MQAQLIPNKAPLRLVEPEQSLMWFQTESSAGADGPASFPIFFSYIIFALKGFNLFHFFFVIICSLGLSAAGWF